MLNYEIQWTPLCVSAHVRSSHRGRRETAGQLAMGCGPLLSRGVGVPATRPGCARGSNAAIAARICRPICRPNTWYYLVLVGDYWDAPQLLSTNEYQVAPTSTSTTRIRIPLGAPGFLQVGSSISVGALLCFLSPCCAAAVDQHLCVTSLPAGKNCVCPVKCRS